MSARNVAGTRLQGTRQTEDNTLPDVPNVRGANAPFTLISYGDYEFAVADELGRYIQQDQLLHPDGEWVPLLKDVIHKAGANGAREVDGPGGKKVVNMAGTYAGIARKGGIVIHPHDRRLTDKYGNYVAHWPVAGATGAFFGFYTTIPRKVGRNVVPKQDTEWILGFKRHLVKVGIVPEMDWTQLEVAVEKIRGRIGDRFDAMTRGQMERAAFEEYRTRMTSLAERMKAAFDRQFGAGNETGGGHAPTGTRTTANPIDELPTSKSASPGGTKLGTS